MGRQDPMMILWVSLKVFSLGNNLLELISASDSTRGLLGSFTPYYLILERRRRKQKPALAPKGEFFGGGIHYISDILTRPFVSSVSVL